MLVNNPRSSCLAEVLSPQPCFSRRQACRRPSCILMQGLMQGLMRVSSPQLRIRCDVRDRPYPRPDSVTCGHEFGYHDPTKVYHTQRADPIVHWNLDITWDIGNNPKFGFRGRVGRCFVAACCALYFLAIRVTLVFLSLIDARVDCVTESGVHKPNDSFERRTR